MLQQIFIIQNKNNQLLLSNEFLMRGTSSPPKKLMKNLIKKQKINFLKKKKTIKIKKKHKNQ